MKRILSLFALASASTIFGAWRAPQQPCEKPFDADLFRKDEQVCSIHTEFLFWRVQESALDYALKMRHSAWGPSQCYAQGKYETATFDGDPGFRVAFSFFRAPKYWEVWGQYTRFTAHGENSSSKPTPATEYLTGTWPQIFTSPLASAKSYLHMNYNVADFLVDRVFFPNPHLRLRVIGGGTMAWIDQFWKIRYQNSSSLETKIGNRWSFIGGGLRTGALFDWYWFTDIYMTGGTTVAALLGYYENKSLQTTNVQPATFDASIPLRNAQYRDIRPTFTSQFYLGPSYQKNFSCSRMELFVGYELTAWFNLQEIYRSTSGTPSQAKETWINTSLVALQGLTTRLTVDF